MLELFSFVCKIYSDEYMNFKDYSAGKYTTLFDSYKTITVYLLQFCVLTAKTIYEIPCCLNVRGLYLPSDFLCGRFLVMK